MNDKEPVRRIYMKRCGRLGCVISVFGEVGTDTEGSWGLLAI